MVALALSVDSTGPNLNGIRARYRRVYLSETKKFGVLFPIGRLTRQDWFLPSSEPLIDV